MAKAIYAGSFDPPTNGHVFMIREGAQLFEQLVVAIGVNPEKAPSFDTETRVRLLQEICAGYDNVSVATFENQFLIRYAAKAGARYILRGIRNGQDFTFERTMRNVNGDLEKDITTVFLIPPRKLLDTSSSFVKGLVGPEGWREVVRGFVPKPVYAEILKKFGG